MNIFKHRRRQLYVCGVALVVLLFTIFICDRIIDRAAADKLYNSTATVPYNKVGLLLGTRKYLKNGSLNPYYQYRIEAATALLKSGKIKYIVVSGDNGTNYYDETTYMKNDLIVAGIDSSVIYPDYAGFRTFDSVVRLKKIFGQDSVTIISQGWHNERAIYLAGREGIVAIGFNAKDVDNARGFTMQVREKLARVKVFADIVFGKQPKFLGEKISIP